MKAQVEKSPREAVTQMFFLKTQMFFYKRKGNIVVDLQLFSYSHFDIY